jgi:hypothetical protein
MIVGYARVSTDGKILDAQQSGSRATCAQPRLALSNIKNLYIHRGNIGEVLGLLSGGATKANPISMAAQA